MQINTATPSGLRTQNNTATHLLEMEKRREYVKSGTKSLHLDGSSNVELWFFQQSFINSFILRWKHGCQKFLDFNTGYGEKVTIKKNDTFPTRLRTF